MFGTGKWVHVGEPSSSELVSLRYFMSNFPLWFHNIVKHWIELLQYTVTKISILKNWLGEIVLFRPETIKQHALWKLLVAFYCAWVSEVNEVDVAA